MAGRLLLAGALIAAAIATFSPPTAAGWEITAAVLLTTGAVLIPADSAGRLRLLFGVAVIAAGIATAGDG